VESSFVVDQFLLNVLPAVLVLASGWSGWFLGRLVRF
jgi:hypothetical protein